MTKSERWSKREIESMLKIWGEESMQDKLKTMKRNNAVFEEMSKKMQKLGHIKTASQIKSKLRNLKIMYQQTKSQNSLSEAHRKFEYFKIMHNVLGEKDETEDTFDSMTAVNFVGILQQGNDDADAKESICVKDAETNENLCLEDADTNESTRLEGNIDSPVSNSITLYSDDEATPSSHDVVARGESTTTSSRKKRNRGKKTDFQKLFERQQEQFDRYFKIQQLFLDLENRRDQLAAEQHQREMELELAREERARAHELSVINLFCSSVKSLADVISKK